MTINIVEAGVMYLLIGVFDLFVTSLQRQGSGLGLDAESKSELVIMISIWVLVWPIFLINEIKELIIK